MARVELPDDFDRLLRKQMAAVPSTAFLPRVRERVAAEKIARSRWSWRMLVPVGALAGASALTISFTGLNERVLTPPPPPRPVLRTLGPIAPAMPLTAETPVAPAGAVRPAASVPAATIKSMPPVVVDVRQRAVLATLLTMVQQGRLTEEAFQKTVRPSLQPIREGVVPIGVNVLEVSPIEAGGVLSFGPEK